MDSWKLNQIDLSLEEILQTLPQSEVAVSRPYPTRVVELDQKIQVAAVRLEPVTCGRPEQLESAHLKSPAQVRQLRSHLIN